LDAEAARAHASAKVKECVTALKQLAGETIEGNSKTGGNKRASATTLNENCVQLRGWIREHLAAQRLLRECLERCKAAEQAETAEAAAARSERSTTDLRSAAPGSRVAPSSAAPACTAPAHAEDDADDDGVPYTAGDRFDAAADSQSQGQV
jgi:hypothetical protein